MSCVSIQKDPLDKTQLPIDYADWLGSTSTIAAATWVVPTGLTASGESFSTTVATNYFEGGTVDQEYEVSCTITTSDSPTRKKTQRVLIQVVNNC